MSIVTTGSNGLLVSGGKVEAEVMWYLYELKRALEIGLSLDADPRAVRAWRATVRSGVGH